LETKYNDMVTQLADAKSKDQTDVTIKAMQDHLDKLDIKMNKKGIENKSTNVTLDNEVKSLFDKAEIKSAIDTLKTNRASSVNMEVKAVGTMTLASYDGNSLTTEIDRTISAAPKRQPYLRNLVNVSTIQGNKVTWVNKEAVEGAAGMTAEGALKSQVSWTYTEESADVKKITAFVKVSKESLDDLDFLRSEINTDLREEIELKLDEQLASGTGLTTNLKGILTYAPTFDVAGTVLATSVSTPNRVDALRVAVALVKKNRFTPTYAVINPMDAALMDLAKGEDGHYILPPFVTADGLRIAGIPIIENEAITEGDFLVGDFNKSNLRIKEEININLGYENDDFTKNLVTILAEMRAVHYIKKHHVNAFLKGTFATAITAITEPVV
jgi:HK97 family phage major capsid protein